MPPKWRLIDHTADVRLEAHGVSVEELFVNAAVGLTSIVMPDITPDPDEECEISVDGADTEDLLVGWLREILFRLEVDAFILSRVEEIKLVEERCEARLLGRRRKPEEEPEMEIKAVTYHGLSIDRTSDGFTARIVFDI